MPQVVAAAVPATVWPPPAHAIGPGWLEWVHGRVRRSFLPPAGSWWDMTATLTDLTRRASCAVPPPFWAALVGAPTVHATPLADTAVSATPAPGTADAGDVAAAPHAPQSVDIVFADLTDTDRAPVDGRLGMIAAGVLRGGGILAVLTRCRPTADGALADVTGGIVASAQDADLLYLQHIVIPDRPLLPVRRTDAAGQRQDLDRPRAHVVVHADLLVFARPRTATIHPGPDTAAADGAAHEATAGMPSRVMTAAASGVRR
jgi:hypothetical protein